MHAQQTNTSGNAKLLYIRDGQLHYQAPGERQTCPETFMKSDAIWHMLTKHLKECNIHTGQCTQQLQA